MTLLILFSSSVGRCKCWGKSIEPKLLNMDHPTHSTEHSYWKVQLDEWNEFRDNYVEQFWSFSQKLTALVL